MVKILQHYDIDKQINAYGYGGAIDNKTSHCFALNGTLDSP